MNVTTSICEEKMQIRIYGGDSLPTLVYLPGLHGDWTLAESFRAAVAGRLRFVELIYPRTLTWSMDDYTDAIESTPLENGIARGWLLGESFGSQFVWTLLARQLDPKSNSAAGEFQVDGAVLSGGFVKHPWS